MKKQTLKSPQPLSKNIKNVDYSLHWSYFMIVGIALLAIWELPRLINDYNNIKSSTQESVTSTPYILKGQIERINWTSEKDLAKEISKRKKPVIIENTIVTQWKALKDWNPEYLSNHPTLRKMRVKLHYDPVITFYEESAPLQNATLGMKEPWKKAVKEELKIRASEFFQKISNQSDPHFYYFSEELRKRDKMSGVSYNKGLTRDIEPNWQFNPNDFPPEYIGLWMGGKGVTASTHYDVSDNFFVQIYGHKKFILFPPEEADKLYLFPRLSPNYRQSQVNMNKPDTKLFPESSQAETYEANLGPGDVLYFPAFWFHHVISVDTCVSVNFWNGSPEWKILEDILFHPLPYDNNFPDNIKIREIVKGDEMVRNQKIVLRVYIDILLAQLYKSAESMQSNAIKSSIVKKRYEPLFDMSVIAKRKDSACVVMEDNVRKQLENVLTPHVSKISKEFVKVPAPIMDQHVANFIEDLAFIMVGTEDSSNPDEAVAYIMNCL